MKHSEVHFFLTLIASRPISLPPSVPNRVRRSFESLQRCIERKWEESLRMSSGSFLGSITARL